MNMEVNKITRTLFGLSPKQVQERIMDMDVVYRNDLSKVQLRLAAAEEKIEDYKKQLEQAAEKERYLMQAIMRSEKEGDTIRQKAIEESQEIMNKALTFAESMREFETEADKIISRFKQQMERLTGTKALPKVELDVDDLISLPEYGTAGAAQAHYTRTGDKKRAENGVRTDGAEVSAKEKPITEDPSMEIDVQAESDFGERRRSLREEIAKPGDTGEYIDYISSINTDDIMDELFNKY